MKSNKKSIGILYIATGEYIVFWKEFYDSFEKYFLPNLERHYYVFTDANEIYQGNSEFVHIIPIEVQPWPLPTLLKYHYFLKAEDSLKERDYLYQSNGPIICNDYVLEEDFLPRDELGEEMIFTTHPGFYDKKRCFWPYDRNKKSCAYVPYNQGNIYVFGAMNGGKSNTYIQWMKELRQLITVDLNRGIIARWHDESHVNHSLIYMKNYRILPMAYAYPDGFEVPEKKIIMCINKSKYFDVDKLKGNKMDNMSLTVFQKVKNAFLVQWEKKIMPNIYSARDMVLCRRAVDYSKEL